MYMKNLSKNKFNWNNNRTRDLNLSNVCTNEHN